ncbi:MAG: hypothetical protein K0S56_520 [Microvirga sp.]|jgi:hypothetical protein|nr:hypothetical protein [Microvirga sp.]
MAMVHVWIDGEIVEVDDATLDPHGDPQPMRLPPISDRQFFQQLALDGEITETEAEDAVATGTVPAALLAVIDTLPAEAQFAARMFLKGATTFERHHPMTLALAALMGWNANMLDALWSNAAGL